MVKTNYRNHEIQIFETSHGTELYLSNSKGEQIYGHKASGDPLQKAIQIIDSVVPNEVCFWCLDEQIVSESGLKSACAFCGKGADELTPIAKNFQREFAATLLMDEADGARMQKALCKAMDELEANDTITFENGVLRFYSRQTGEQRIVTKFGCSRECDCLGEISYHLALYKLLDSNVREFSFLRVIDTDDERSFGFPAAA